MVSKESEVAGAPLAAHANVDPSTHSDDTEPPSQSPQKPHLMEAVKLKPRHARSPSDSDVSEQSSGFDDERPSQDDDDIDNTPATSYGGFLSGRSDISAGPKSDSSRVSNVKLLNNSGLSVASDDPDRMDELTQEVEALFEKFLPDFQTQQDESEKSHSQGEPTLLSRNLPAILSEFERQRNHPLIDPKVYSMLEAFVNENPDAPISSNMLVHLIHALESSARSVISDDMDPKTPSLMDRQTSHSTGNDSTPIAASDDLADLSHEEYLIRDIEGSRDNSRELSAEAAIILNLKEDLRMERDKNDALQQTLSDKERRVNTLEHKLTTAQEQFEETMLEEQAKLEELNKQIQTLRREDKENRTKQYELQEQNNAYESQLTSLNTQIDASEKAQVKLRRDLEEESSQLLKTKADLDRRLKDFKELSEYLKECEQARDTAENASVQLRQELEQSRAEAARLQRYKEEAEGLQTTVNELEMDLDEMRRLTNMHSKESLLQQQSNPGTLTRRLGNELARSMELANDSSGEDTQVEDKDADTSNVEDFIETVIQRRRRRVGKTRRSIEMITQSIQTEVPSDSVIPVPIVEVVAKAFPESSSREYTMFSSLSSAVATRTTTIIVALFAIGLVLGLSLNTSRDIYHIHHRSLDAGEFRKLNHLPESAQIYYYDGRYPNAVVGSNFVDDYVGPVLDAILGLAGLGNPSKATAGGIVY
ncbi:uncharacterized protein MEPE_00578 [Melanopsichium pennsylvanicum]|uniref:Uncharacterized protein n=2 Tax=Melanopsichium pennsylvanicum TaxID=63383 RepID=A0AAJ4XGS8_9BASI|nr:conserved hypothetical protein [Melanopsichium pennsylvanicum 4]SNX81873.1 uncharacterized protein MEPE_00578 [Melanopsichium pennsylvanicum]